MPTPPTGPQEVTDEEKVKRFEGGQWAGIEPAAIEVCVKDFGMGLAATTPIISKEVHLM